MKNGILVARHLRVTRHVLVARRVLAWGTVTGLIAVGALAVGASAGAAQTTTAVTGEMFMAGKTPVDPPQNEPKETHSYMTITGPAALRMYRSMKAREAKNLCEEGKMIKRAGRLACSIERDGKNATCDFSINLTNGSLADGRPC
jgi:hypothetical protein